MNEETKAVIKYRLERMRESLRDGQQLFANGSLHSVVNRIYYSLFYSVTALLLTKELSSSKHSGVKALFNREFVNIGEVDTELGKFYSEIFEQRQKSDYKDFVEFQKQDVELWLRQAEEFIQKIEELLQFR